MKTKNYFFEKESKQLELLKNAEEDVTHKTEEKITFLFKTFRQLSISALEDALGFYNDSAKNYLSKLESDEKIIKLEDRKEISYTQCGSVKKHRCFSVISASISSSCALGFFQ